MAKFTGISSLLLLVAPLASAQIFECAAKDGTDRYQNFPCGIDSIGSVATQAPPEKAGSVHGDSKQAKPKGRSLSWGCITRPTFKDYAATYQHEQCVIVQLESPKAIAAIEEIGAVEDVDALFIGPNDLAATMGLFGNPGAPEVRAVIADAIVRINKTGKAAGILNFNIGEARAW